MARSTANIEPAARAICAKVLARDGKSEETPAHEFEMYRHVVLAEMTARIIDDKGSTWVSGAGAARRMPTETGCCGI